MFQCQVDIVDLKKQNFADIVVSFSLVDLQVYT